MRRALRRLNVLVAARATTMVWSRLLRHNQHRHRRRLKLQRRVAVLAPTVAVRPTRQLNNVYATTIRFAALDDGTPDVPKAFKRYAARVFAVHWMSRRRRQRPKRRASRRMNAQHVLLAVALDSLVRRNGVAVVRSTVADFKLIALPTMAFAHQSFVAARQSFAKMLRCRHAPTQQERQLPIEV